MSPSTAQIDEKSWLDIITILPRIVPPIIDAISKSQGGTKASGPAPPQLPNIGDDPEKFWNILIPVLTSVIPAVVDAVTKGFGGSLGGGLSTPFGNLSVGGNVQVGKSAVPPVDEKIWGDILRLVLPPLIGAITKGPQPTTTVPVAPTDEKFWNLIPLLLPPLIDIITKGQQPPVAASADNEKFLNLLPIILPTLISVLTR